MTAEVAQQPLGNELLHALQPSIMELENIWQYIGFDGEQRVKQVAEVVEVLQRAFHGCIEAATAHRVALETQIETQKKRTNELCLALRLPPFFAPHGLPSYQLLRLLESKEAEFISLRAERLKNTKELYAKIKELCNRLEVRDLDTALQHLPKPPDDDEDDDVAYCLSDQELTKVQEKARDLQETYDALLAKFKTLREDVHRIADDVDYEPEGEFEEAVLRGDAAKEPELLTNKVLEDMQSWRLRLVKHKAMLVGTCDELRGYLSVMWRRLGESEEHQKQVLEQCVGYRPSVMEQLQEETDRCQEQKWSQMGEYHSRICQEVVQLSNRCFEETPPCAYQTASEEAVNALEHELDRLEVVYEQNKVMFESVATYQQMWEAYVEVEHKLKDPAILSNRGGIMLKVDKEKKRLLKELPRVEQEVSSSIAKFESDTGSVFRMSRGRSFQDYVQQLNAEFRTAMDAAKIGRKTSRATTLEASDPVNTLRESQRIPSASPHRSPMKSGKR